MEMTSFRPNYTQISGGQPFGAWKTIALLKGFCNCTITGDTVYFAGKSQSKILPQKLINRNQTVYCQPVLFQYKIVLDRLGYNRSHLM
jgi:hypothetical protein